MDTIPNAGSDLVRIHKVITRALDISIQNSTGASLDEHDRQGFVSYVRAMVILLHAHHSGEDELAFPFWKTRMPNGPYDELYKQHAEMVEHLDQIEQWIKAGPDAWQENSVNKLGRSLSALRELWNTHITLEEATVGPEKSQEYLTLAENEQLSKQLSEHGQALSQPGELVMPFIVYNLSRSDRDEFIGILPPIMTQQLIPVAWKAAWEPMTPFLLVE